MSKREKIIQIIGIGVVGTAFAYTLRSLGYNVKTKDLNLGKLDLAADIFFICTHEKDVRNVLKDSLPFVKNKPIVIKATMTPSAFRKLREEFPSHHLSTNPEFIREKTAFRDSLNPEFHIIGECCKKDGDIIEGILKNLGCPIVRTTPENALMIKLAHNAYLATLISFWNEIAKISKDLDPNLVAKSCSLSSRISEYGTNLLNFPYAGRCLPKDIKQLISFAKEKGVDPILLKAVREVNKKVGKA